MKLSIARLILLITIINFIPVHTTAQNISVELNQNWQFKNQKESQWYKAEVPGTIHTDLLANKLIPDPHYRDNESKLQWIDKADWEYKTSFGIDKETFRKKNIELVFDGLDTYADVYLNGKLILQADNMFRGWAVNVKNLLKRNNNELLIKFCSAQNKADSIAKARLPLVLPDNNRVYVRKAQFQFGWDWGPKFVGCGIWKGVKLIAEDIKVVQSRFPLPTWWPGVKLVQQKDAIGKSFHFEQNGKPIYCKGANWIPADVFLPRITKDEYRKLLLMAKEANMNMLRVWGGGVYESDDFYDLCDSLGIMVWQDFMFAGGMYPGDEAFMNNVREEVKYQVVRLRHHPCIVLWCGNNEIDEAWKNWGWQKQFNLHGDDSAKVWNDYKRLFEDSLEKWVAEFDGTRPYVSTSPKNGWGRKESFTEGDSHYWGLWWGLEDWEVFENKTGRFVSEYGMQAMPNWNTIKSFTDSADRYLYSPVLQAHQKAMDGFKKLNHYLTRYFIDSARLSRLSLEEYSYLTQCLQFYILRNSIATHRSKYPANMGTLLWQLNDCWPVTSWSITDYSRHPKAAWYAVKEAYRDDAMPAQEALTPKELKLQKPEYTVSVTGNAVSIRCNANAKYVYVYSEDSDLVFSANYFDLYAGIAETISANKAIDPKKIKVMSLYDVLYK
jgi:beta-mannosidase